MRLALILLGCLIASPIYSATLHVRAGAGGANNGTDWNNAYTTLPPSGGFVRGNTYYVAAGGYSGFTANTANSGTTKIIVRKATVAEHGSETGWNAAYANAATFSSPITAVTDYWEFDGAYRDNNDWFDRTAYGFQTSMGGVGYAFRTSASDIPGADPDFVTVKYWAMYEPVLNLNNNSTAMYLVFAPMDNWLVSKCLFENNHYSILNSGTSGWTVEECVFWKIYGKEVIRPQGDNVVNWTIRNNKFLDCNINSHLGFPWFGGATAEIASFGYTGNNNWKIYGNIFHDTGTYQTMHNAGVIVGGFGGYPAVSGWRVYNNILSRLDSNGAGGNQIAIIAKGSDNWVHNNIFFEIPTHRTISITASSALNNWATAGSSGLASMIASFPTTKTGTANPFVNVAAYNFAPADPATVSGEDIVDNGAVVTGQNNADPLGNIRGNDGTWDIGVFEYNGVPLAPVITSSTNVTATNLASMTYSITVANGATSYGATNLPPDLVINPQTGVISGSLDTSIGTNVIGLLATNVTGSDHKSLFLNIVAPSNDPVLSVSATNTAWGEQATNTVRDFVFTVSNIGVAASTLTGYGTNASTGWTFPSNKDFNLAGGTSTNISVRFVPGSVGQFSGFVQWVTTAAGNSSNAITGAAFPVFEPGTTYPAIHGLIYSPFVTNSGYVSQPTTTLGFPMTGGRAVYGFRLTGDTTFQISNSVDSVVNSDSFFVGVNGNVASDLNSYIWDVFPRTTGWEKRIVSIRGNTEDHEFPEFPDREWTGFVGINTVVYRGRELECKLQNITIDTTGSPGGLPDKATSPMPANGATNVVGQSNVLMWVAGNATTSFNVYYGTNSGALDFVSAGQVDTFYQTTNAVNYSVEHFWRIDSINGFGTTTGDLWSFTLQDVPPADPPTPQPDPPEVYGLRIREGRTRFPVGGLR